MVDEQRVSEKTRTCDWGQHIPNRNVPKENEGEDEVAGG